MSDTESGDDDGFDREAEKQRLREKYEQDKEDRQATERMSELLLQGATMTNKHCDDCGNPIFRYDGQEFCSVCGDAGGEQSQAAAGDGQQPGAADRQAADQQAAAGQQPATTDDASAPTAETDAADAREADARAGRPAPDPQPTPSREPTPQATGDAGDLDAARASLARTITEFSRRAEETRDASHARDLLAAAREAAEALAELERLR